MGTYLQGDVLATEANTIAFLTDRGLTYVEAASAVQRWRGMTGVEVQVAAAHERDHSKRIERALDDLCWELRAADNVRLAFGPRQLEIAS
jgi:hypothetical protein